MVVSAVVVLAVIAGAAWAAGRPPGPAERAAASASRQPSLLTAGDAGGRGADAGARDAGVPRGRALRHADD